MAVMDREKWLEERRKGIGGSDAAALVGMNSYSTPYMVWADKTGRLPEKENSEAMRQGRDLEQYVAERFTEATGKKVRRHNDIIRNPQYPFAHANIDRAVIGEKAGLECKTTSIMNLKKFKNGEFPENYYAQCVHYMAVTGWERWYLAVLVLNQGFYWFVIERDEDEIEALMKAEKEFWETYVTPDVPPPVDGLKPTSAALSAIFRDAGSQEGIDLFGRETLIREYLETKEIIKRYERENEQRKQMLQQDLAAHELGQAGSYSVTWKFQSKRSFDPKAFSRDYPNVDLSRYYSTTYFRKFDIKERS